MVNVMRGVAVPVSTSGKRRGSNGYEKINKISSERSLVSIFSAGMKNIPAKKHDFPNLFNGLQISPVLSFFRVGNDDGTVKKAVLRE